MASLDFITDLAEKFRKQDIDYVIISLQKGTKGNKIHVFDCIETLQSLKQIKIAMKEVNKQLKELEKKFSKDEQ